MVAVAFFAAGAPSAYAQPSPDELAERADSGFVDPRLDQADTAARWVPTGGGWVEKLEYSETHGVLILQFKFGERIRIVDTNAQTVINEHLPTTRFTDLSVSPDGHYMFAIDQARNTFDDNIGPSYVHRYDVRGAKWDVLETPPQEWHSLDPPGHIEALSASRVLLMGNDQWVDLSLNTFSVWKNRMQELDRHQSVGYYGDIAYNPQTGLVYYTEREQIRVFRVDGPGVSFLYETGREGITKDQFGTPIVSADGEHFVWGKFQLDPQDVNQLVRRYPTRMVGATADWGVASNGDLQHLDTGEVLDAPFWPSAATVGWGSNDLWLAHREDPSILHCQTSADTVGCPVVVPDPLTACQAPTIDMNTNGGDGTGTPGDDIILGTPGNDLIRGGGGNDILCGQGGNDVIHGGPGEDQIVGGDGDDTMTGGPDDDTMQGGEGHDILHGYRGDDYLKGDAGDDRLFGYAGADILLGGDGNDRLHGNFGNDILAGEAGNDALFGYGDHDSLYGGEGDDRMSGNFGDDILIGEGGNDTMFGGDGNDGLAGGDGNDVIEGNSLDDVLLGGFGDDTLDGGIGQDYCDGEDGIDTAARCERTLGIP